MKTKLLLFFQLFLITFSGFSQSIPVDSLYLGQTPPGNIPKIFIAKAHARLAITNDGKTIYFCQSRDDFNNTSYYTYRNDKWNGPLPLFGSSAAPSLSIHEDTLFTMENRGLYRSFYSTKKDSGWSTPLPVSEKTRYYLQETNQGNFYFGDNNPAGGFGKWDLCKMANNNGSITIQNMGLPLNTGNNDSEFFIAKDESYMVIGANEGGPGGRDLYISYRKSDNSWTKPKSLGALINDGNFYKWGPFVTPDNKYLFYAREPRPYNIYWVRFDNLLDSLKHTNFEPYIKTPVKDTIAAKETQFTFHISDSTFFDDDGNNTLTYKAVSADNTPLPAWLSFNPETRTFSGTTPSGGWYPVKIMVTDDAGETVSCLFTVVISHPPVLNQPIRDTTVIENKKFSLRFTTSTHFSDYDQLAYSLTLADGTPLPSWLKCSFSTNYITLTGTPVATDTLLLKMTATDMNHDHVSDTFMIVVNKVSTAIGNNFNSIPFELFPNPTKGAFTLKGKTSMHGLTAEVFDMQGKPVIKQLLNKENRTTINLSGYPTGTYLVSVNGNGENFRRKICLE
jgi:hypothetical protein